MSIIVAGKVWKLGDHVYSDYMDPGFARKEVWEERKKYVLHIHKTFAGECRPGDVIVAGRNFGCGPSREGAAGNLKRLGIGCVVGESFARIFFRNCIAIGLPIMKCEGVSEIFEEGDQLELDFENARVKNLTTEKELQGPRLSPDLIKIVEEGGIFALLKGEFLQNS
jgi:3-isopropylmalate/(R)-2-methylmalate dehydratase small subunit